MLLQIEVDCQRIEVGLLSLFSERLRWLREKSGLSQKEMASFVGRSQQGYSGIETGRREPNLEVLSKLPRILGESLDFMLGVTDYNKELEKMNERITTHVSRIQESFQALAAYLEVPNANVDLEFFSMRTAQVKSDIQRLADNFKEIKNIYIEQMENIPMISEESKKQLEYLKGIHNTEDILKAKF